MLGIPSSRSTEILGVLRPQGSGGAEILVGTEIHGTEIREYHESRRTEIPRGHEDSTQIVNLGVRRSGGIEILGSTEILGAGSAAVLSSAETPWSIQGP